MKRLWLLVMLTLLVGCGGEEEEECIVDETYNPTIEPANFGTTVDNPLFPLTPGTRYLFQGGDETIEVTVTRETREILGVTCIVVRDTVTVDGELIEDTYDWYAQDNDGNVWYMGEDTKEYEDGVLVSTEGSWEAGVDGAKPGTIMLANPEVGDTYRQEYYACEAEDMGEVLSLTESVSVPYGNFTNCVMIRDYTPLEPDVNEHKYYCPGIGVALEVEVDSGLRTELVSVTTF